MPIAVLLQQHLVQESPDLCLGLCRLGWQKNSIGYDCRLANWTSYDKWQEIFYPTEITEFSNTFYPDSWKSGILNCSTCEYRTAIGMLLSSSSCYKCPYCASFHSSSVSFNLSLSYHKLHGVTMYWATPNLPKSELYLHWDPLMVIQPVSVSHK